MFNSTITHAIGVGYSKMYGSGVYGMVVKTGKRIKESRKEGEKG